MSKELTTPLVSFYQNIQKATGLAPATVPGVPLSSLEDIYTYTQICRYGRWVLVEARWYGGNHVIVELPLLAA